MNASYLNASQKIKDYTPLAGDAGNRLYSRVRFEGSDKDYILCKYPEPNSKQLSNFLDVYSLLAQNSVNTPEVIESSTSQMLLEDLGDLSLEQFYKSGGKPYSSALDQLVNIQKIPLIGKSKAQSFSFTVEKFVWEMNFTVSHFAQLLKIDLSEKEAELLHKDFIRLCTHLCGLEQVITHRDLHSRNIMMSNEKAYIIDFQDARIGPKFYDLVSLIEDSYTDLNTEHKKTLINEYCKKTNVVCDPEFMENYHLQNLQRSFKACGSFASFKTRTNNERYLEYLEPAFKSLFESCNCVTGFEKLKSFITASSEKWKDYEK